MRKRASLLGSSSSTEQSRIRVGRLGKPNGLEGYIGLYAESDDLVYFEPGSVVLVGDQPQTVRDLRRGKKGPQVAFAGIADRPGAEELRGSDVFVTERRQLEEGEFWPADLVGLEARPGGGLVVAVAYGPTQDRLVIEREGWRFEIPFVEALVPIVDLHAGFIEIVEIEGLSAPPGDAGEGTN